MFSSKQANFYGSKCCIVVILNYFNVYEIYKVYYILVTTGNIKGFVLELIKNIVSINPIQIVLFKKCTFR